MKPHWGGKHALLLITFFQLTACSTVSTPKKISAVPKPKPTQSVSQVPHPRSAWSNLVLKKRIGSIVESDKPVKIRHPRIGTRSSPHNSPVRLTLIARFQSYSSKSRHSRDQFDADIDSPKSVRFSLDGKKVYVNSLEAYKTLIFGAAKLNRIGVISHSFTEADASLFQNDNLQDYAFDSNLTREKPNVFSGKPTESTLSNEGRFLWIPYYRRNFDLLGTNPSAVAIVDTQTDKIVRVMATGPISKYVAASPDNHFMAVSHWGDNSLYLIDISSGDPAQFTYKAHMIVEKLMDLSSLGVVNRDQVCGFCLRGLAYSADGRYLFVARMGGPGGIAVFDLSTQPDPTYVGSINGTKPKPRDILASKTGEWLYVSASMSGYVSKIAVKDVFSALATPSKAISGFSSTFVGLGPRSIRLSPDERYLFISVYQAGQVVAVDTKTMRVVSTIKADPYPVGLTVSPDGNQIWTTSQSKAGNGGNSIMIFKVKYHRH